MDFLSSMSRTGGKVLVLANDPVVCGVLRTGLEGDGWQVRFFTGPLEGVPTEVRDGADCLILDMGLLGRSAAAVVRSVRREFPALAVLVLAGDPQVDDVFDVIRAGADDFIRKPVNGPQHISLAMRRLSNYRTSILESLKLRMERERLREQERPFQERLRFFRFASHELKTPLVAVSSSIRAALEMPAEELGPRARGLLDRSVRRCEQMLSMINDMLAISLDRSDLQSFYEEADLAQLVRDSLAIVAPVMEAKGLMVCADVPGDPLPAWCNRQGIEKVVENLLSNAVRYTPPGGRIEVSLSPEQGLVCYRVADTGIGIPAEEKERVFEEFYRARNARKEVSFGSGLGLALVRKVVREHDGWIDLVSEEGKGSTFSVWIPVRQRPVQQVPGDTTSHHPRNTAVRELR